jgi:hypothetical protein
VRAGLGRGQRTRTSNKLEEKRARCVRKKVIGDARASLHLEASRLFATYCKSVKLERRKFYEPKMDCTELQA